MSYPLSIGGRLKAAKSLVTVRTAIAIVTAVICGTALFASPANADPYDDNNCSVTAFVDRQDRTTNTYGAGWLSCDRKVHDATTVDVKLYKNGDLVARGRNACGTPVHNYCYANTDLVGGSPGVWQAVVVVETRIGGVSHRTVTATDTRTW